VVRRPEFQVDPLALDLSGCPDWVNAEQMGRELRGELGRVPTGRSIFDPDIAGAVQRELNASPWVLEVRAVERQLPNTLLVRALFRKPAGRVLMAGRQYLVDAEGYWLREDLFRLPSEWAAERTPFIVDRLLDRPPTLGERWGGPRLAVGGRLAELLRRRGLFERLLITTIDVTGVGKNAAEPEVFLTTAGGTIVKWGRSSAYGQVPGLQRPVFLTPDSEKVEMLLSKLDDYPELEGVRYLDLRFHGQIIFAESR
jgi:hypothetical protein